MSGKIYLICKDGEPKYCGFTTKSIDQRWKEHCYSAIKCVRKNALCDAIRKYGPDAFTIRLEIEHPNEEYCLCVLEGETIEAYGTHYSQGEGGYNLTWGGEGALGYKHSPESLAKMSAALKGKSHPQPPEVRAKISKANKGKKQSDEHRAKLGAIRKGKKRSPETCAKMRASWAKRKEKK